MAEKRIGRVRDRAAPYATSLLTPAEEVANPGPCGGSPRSDGRGVDVRPGYKQTDVGGVPEDWDVEPLGKYATFRTGPFGSALHKSDYTNDGIPVVNPMHIVDGKIEPTRTMTITKQAARNLCNFRLKPGEIVIGRRGDMGRCAVVQEHQSGWLCGTGSMIVRALNADAEFLQRVLSSPRAIAAIEDSSVGTTMVNLNQGTLAGLKIQFPPLAEQRAIAAALSDVDALLDGLERLIAKKRDLKQAAMQQLLTGQTRLPGFSGKWEVKRLGNFGSTYGGLTGKTKADFVGGEASYITFMNVMKNVVIDCETFEHVSVSPNENQNRAKKGDLFFNGSSETPEEVAMCAVLLEEVNDVYLNSFCFGFRFREGAEVDGVFLAYYLRNKEGRELMKSLAQGSTRYNLSKVALLNSSIRLPSLPEQTAIARVLSDMDAELSALEARRDKTRALKQAMMQELLTGRTRLVAPNADLAENGVTQKGARQANVYFMRSVLAAEIVDRLHEEPTFGHVKFEKLLFLVEHLGGIDTGSTYLRKAAGPYDNRALRSIDSQLRKQKWFDARNEQGRYRYVPMDARGDHKRYFERYFSDISDVFEKVVSTFRTLDTERCEIVATLFSAWNDLLREGKCPSDDSIVNEVLNNWHESKRRIPEERWLKALAWMRDKGFVPKGS